MPRTQITHSPRGKKMESQGSCHPYEKGAVIKCDCGFEIPVIPDIEAVGYTIDAHVEEHRKQLKNPIKGEHAAKEIHDSLFKKLFDKIILMST
jgi:hypothetical protein